MTHTYDEHGLCFECDKRMGKAMTNRTADFRHVKVKPAGERARWWWIKVFFEDENWIHCERINKQGEPIDAKEHLIDQLAVIDSKQAKEDFFYGTLEEVA